MTNRLVDPLLLGRPLAFEWPRDNDRNQVPRGGGNRKKRASSVSALLVMLVAALVMVPVALADDDDDDGPSTPTVQDLCTAAAAAQNHVTNGDFEFPPVPPFATYFAPGPGPPPWMVAAGSVDQVNGVYWKAACGNQSMDLTGSPGQGTLTQNIAGTIANEEYRLRFAYAANPDPLCSPAEPAQVRMLVRWGGLQVADLTVARVEDTTNVPPQPNWQTFETTVVAPGSAVLLEFDSESGTFCGPTIDAVSVTIIVDGDGDDDDDDDEGDDDGGDDDGGDDDGGDDD